jgi:hypothetical protein
VDEGEWVEFIGQDQALRTAILSEARLDDG